MKEHSLKIRDVGLEEILPEHDLDIGVSSASRRSLRVTFQDGSNYLIRASTEAGCDDLRRVFQREKKTGKASGRGKEIKREGFGVVELKEEETVEWRMDGETSLPNRCSSLA